MGILRIVALLALLSASLGAWAYDPTDDLNTVFGSRCESFSSPMVQSALSQSGALKGIIQAIRDDKKCTGVFGALSHLEALRTSRLLEPTRTSLEGQRLRSNAANLEAALLLEQSKASPNQSLLSSIESELNLNRVLILTHESADEQQTAEIRLETIDHFRNYSEGLMAALAESRECVTDHPNLIAQIGAQMLAVSSSLFGGVTGAIFLASGHVINRFLTFLNELRYSSQLQALVQARLSVATHCALEALGSTYCQARDVEVLTRQNAIYLERFKSPTQGSQPIWEGIRLVSRDMPVFLRWAQRIDAGARVSSEAQAAEKRAATELEATYRILRDRLNALVARSEKKLGQPGIDPATERDTLIDLLFAELAGNAFERTKPFYQVFRADRACGPFTELYTNRRVHSCIPQVGEGCRQCLQRIEGVQRLTPPSIKDIQETLEALLSEAGDFVASEVSLVKENNPQQVLSQCWDEGTNRSTACDFLTRAKAYLQKIDAPSRLRNPAIARTVALALGRVEASLELLLKPTDNPSNDVTEIGKLLAPSGDVFFFANEIRTVVRQDLEAGLARGDMNPELTDILRASTSDNVGMLAATFFGLDSTLRQAAASKDLTKSNLQILADVFAPVLIQSIETAAREDYEDYLEHDEKLSLLCVRSTLIPSSPMLQGTDLRALCAKRVLYSGHRGSGIMVSYDALTDPKTKFSTRVCSIYDFYRQSRLFEASRPSRVR